MTEDNKYSPGKLYEFKPDDKITSDNVIELCNVIRVGVGGHVLKEMSEELQAYFKEVA
jgi:hypothetical protein